MFPVVLRPGTCRLVTLYRAVKVMALPSFLVAIVIVIRDGIDPRAIVTAVALYILVLGALDIADGISSIESSIDRTHNTVRRGRPARRYATGKIIYGTTACILSAFGLIL